MQPETSASGFGLAMADSLVYATARRFGATLVTTDADFEGLADAVVVR